jgi:oxygen-independent coproporphyrinogen-3 oxidase
VAGLYLNVPFRHVPAPAAARRFVRAVAWDATRRIRPLAAHAPLHTLLVGGPRPSRLGVPVLCTLMAWLGDCLDLRRLTEATLEAAAADLAPSDLPALADAGFTRLSVRPPRRSCLDARTGRLLEAAREILGAASLDLRFGGARPTLRQWRTTLAAVANAPLKHVTLVEESGGPPKHAAQGFALAQERLADAGFRPYELTHWACPGYEARHIADQYAYDTLLGLGPDAESFWRGPTADRPVFRTRTVAPPDRYAARLARGASPLAARRRLPRRDQGAEYLMLRLRTADGLHLPTLHVRFGVDLPRDHGPLLKRLQNAGHLVCEQQHLRLTASGRALADGILAALLPA